MRQKARKPRLKAIRQREEGAVLVLFALVLTALLMMAALAVDLAALRQDRRADRLASDAAAAAAAGTLDPFDGSKAADACNVAWEYVRDNVVDEGTVVTPPGCTTLSGGCDGATAARAVTGIAGPYRVTIVHPVPDGHTYLGSQAVNVATDGTSCQRIAVHIRRGRDFAFAGVMGFEQGSTNVVSVAKTGIGCCEGELVPLVVLDPTGCSSLTASGQGAVRVEANGLTPGIIVVDSSGTALGNALPGCDNANSYVINTNDNDLNYIRAEPAGAIAAQILSHALAGTRPGKSHDPADAAANRIQPRPQAIGRRVTRSPIDWRYNCKSSYAQPAIRPCLGTPDPDIDNLIRALALPGSHPAAAPATSPPTPAGTPPPGFRVYPTDPALTGAQCAPPSSAPAITVPFGDWFVDCPGSGPNPGFSVSNRVTFGGGRLVFRDGISVGSHGSLTLGDGSGPTIAYVRSGDLVKDAQGLLSMPETFVFLQNGATNIGAGSGSLLWTAPDDPGYEYDDLALWSESNRLHRIGGQAALDLEGLLFMPNASPFRFSGQGDINQTRAQFVTHRLEVSGQGVLVMSPDPDRSTPLPLRQVRLIR